MKNLNTLTKLVLLFGERFALIPLLLLFAFIFSIENTENAYAQQKIFRQNYSKDGLSVVIGSLENVDFGKKISLPLPSPTQNPTNYDYDNSISIKLEVVRVPVTPTPAPVAEVFASGDIWERIAECESRKNWSINTGNGYFGGLQFSQGAWNSVGGSGLPSDASREEQIERGKMLQSRRGWGVWGDCAKKLNLL